MLFFHRSFLYKLLPMPFVVFGRVRGTVSSATKNACHFFFWRGPNADGKRNRNVEKESKRVGEIKWCEQRVLNALRP